MTAVTPAGGSTPFASSGVLPSVTQLSAKDYPKTRSLSQAKILGGIGSILLMLLLLPFGVGVASVIAGWILILFAAKEISGILKDESIFNYAAGSAVIAIASTAIFASIVSVAVLGQIGFPSLLPAGSALGAPDSLWAVAGLINGIFLAWVLGLIASIFLWQSFNRVSLRMNASLFGTAALIYIIGSVLKIVLIGFLLSFVAEILFVIAFFSLPEILTVVPPQTQITGSSDGPSAEPSASKHITSS